MCLNNRKEVQIPQVEAFKMFVVDNGVLKSPFKMSYYNDEGEFVDSPPFEPEVLIQVQPADKTFFAFQRVQDACDIANAQAYKGWNVQKFTLLVLPVTLKNVVATGTLHVPSDDPQCLDGYYPCYESKEIMVHDSPEIRRDVCQKVLIHKLEHSHGLSYMERQALEQLKASA